MKDKNIKVLMIGSDLSVKGGIASVVKQFLEYNWKENIELNYIATHIDGNTIKKSLYYFKSLIKVLLELSFKKIDIVHVHMSHTGSFYRKYIIFKLSKVFRKKIIIHLHGSEFKKFFDSTNQLSKYLIRDMLKRVDKFLVLGKNWEQIIKSIEPKSNTQILLNTISIPTELSKPNDSEVNILFLGSLVVRKGIYELIEVIRILKEKFILDKYRVKFIFGGSGPEEENLIAKIKEYSLEKYIKMEGWVTGEKKIELIKMSHIFLLPSHNEGLPIAILEAISYGLPVISTQVGSIDEAVIDGYNGKLIEAKNTQQIEKVLIKLIEDSNLRRKYSENSRKLSESKFNENKYFIEIQSLYKSLSDE